MCQTANRRDLGSHLDPGHEEVPFLSLAPLWAGQPLRRGGQPIELILTRQAVGS